MKRKLSIKLKICLFVSTLLFAGQQTRSQSTEKKTLTDIAESAIPLTGERYTFSKHYRTLHLNKAEMQQLLSQAPIESPAIQRTSNLIFDMPMPDGSFSKFRIYETLVMDPALAAKFPEIKTYAGQGIDDANATIRLDMTPLGFHAMVLSPNGSVFIDPYCQNTAADYICYYKKDLFPSSHFVCEAGGDNNPDNYRNIIPSELYEQKTSGTQLRTYRLALACTGEYAATKGGTVSGAMAGMATSMNRVNGVYETEVAIHMTMVANDNLIVYTNSSTDPYTNSNGSTMLGQNQTTCDNVIGSSNYDIGHVFSTGGGGVAYLGVVCGGNKAGGVTGSSNPVGDAFDIDYVAHEMGHQFGGNHCFNSTTGSCGGGNRNSSAAYEPGSGITIMAYAGICGSDDLAPHSIAYFHTKSFDEIVNYSTTSTGNTCPVITSTGNIAPVVTSIGSAHSIPISTPFVLTGAATDANGDPLTYSWEQYDLGAASTWNATQTAGSTWPLFRPFTPTSSPSRTFPQLSDIINNTTTVGEVLPTVARTLHFRLTVRDNRTGGGGVMHPDTTLNITVVNNGGAFAVTTPNTAVSWSGGSTQTVTWNVNGTTNSPISCANVKISLSTDGGNTFPTIIVASTANDGTESITVPGVSTTQARIKVEAVGNIFFDMSNVNFTITSSTLSAITTSAISPASYCAGAAVNVPYSATGSANGGNIFTAQLSNSAGSFASPTAIGTLTSTTSGTIAATIPAGTATGSGYRIRVVSSSPVVTGSDNGSNISISAQVGAAGSISGFNDVCEGTAPFYTVGSIANATTYNWTVPANDFIINGAGTSTVQVALSTSGNITVYGSNANCTGASSSLFVTVHPSPSIQIVNGGGSYCSGGSGVAVGLNGSQTGTAYQLKLNGSSTGSPVNGTGAAISFGNQTSAGTYTVVANTSFGCTATMQGSTTVTINSLPNVTANNVSGCAGTAIALSGAPAGGTWSVPNPYTGSSTTYTHTYTDGNGCTNTSSAANITVNPLPSVSFSGLAASYNISSPPATLTGSPAGGTFSGPGISGNTFSPSSAGVGGPYTISYSYTDGNGCTNSSSQQTTVTNCTVPAQPGTITAAGGNTKVCPGDTKTYGISAVSGATSYTWTPPVGGVITNGQGTTSVIVNYTSSFTATDTIHVVANNGCGSSPQRTLKITRNTPATPSVITGQNYVVCDLSGVPYSVTNVAGMTYNWSFSVTGAAVSSGQGTNAITADFAAGNFSGSLRVTANNACGAGNQRALTIYAKPATPVSITGATSVCVNQQNVPYSISAIPFATNYTWIGPTGSHISDGVTTSSGTTLITNSTSVTVNYGSSAGTLKARANNSCGSSSYKSITITFNCRDGVNLSLDDFVVNINPNPANDVLNISFISEKESIYNIRLNDIAGKTILSRTGNSLHGENNFVLSLDKIAKGFYFLEVINGDKKSVSRIVVN